MRIIIKAATKNQDNINKLKQEILTYSLHIGSDGHMADWAALNPCKIRAIAIAYHKGKPIGAAMIVRGCYTGRKKQLCPTDIGVFVKAKYRRHGIGSKLAKRVIKFGKPKFAPWMGEKRAENFYQTIGLAQV